MAPAAAEEAHRQCLDLSALLYSVPRYTEAYKFNGLVYRAVMFVCYVYNSIELS